MNGDEGYWVRVEAVKLGELEEARATEYVRLVALGDNPYLAGQKVDAEYARQIAVQRAEYEIALSRLRR